MVRPIYILGPCAAESREQIIETVSRICDLRFEISNLIFRAGIWKPRTSPQTFQGVGEEGLKWLQEVQRTFGVPVATEVATPEHVRMAMEAGIDYLWIGARSSANPIVVQNLSDIIRNYPIRPKGIFIKNPVNADAGLWIGNIERLEKTGLPVMAVHRGCNHKPCWHMAHAVRLARPDIPMLLDPSHMSGDATKVPELMKKVEELGLDGAMIEVHAHPEAALSDAKQQIRPQELSELIRVYPNLSESIGEDLELNWLRAEIDELDEQILTSIMARMDVSRRIGTWKKAHGMAPLQPERFQKVLERLKGLQVTGNGLPEELIEKVWNAIHEESLHMQS